MATTYKFNKKTFKTETGYIRALFKEAFRVAELAGESVEDIKDEFYEFTNDIKEKAKAKARIVRKARVDRGKTLHELPQYIETVLPSVKLTSGERKERYQHFRDIEGEVNREIRKESRTAKERRESAISERITMDTIDYHREDMDDEENRNELLMYRLTKELNQSKQQGLLINVRVSLLFTCTDLKAGQDVARRANGDIQALSTTSDINELLTNLSQEFENTLDFAQKTSDLIFKHFDSIKISIVRQLQARYTGAYIEEDEQIKNSLGCVNIKNTDERCLEYCISRYYYDNELKGNKTNIKKYDKYIKFIKIPVGQVYPICIETDIVKYEKLNRLKINVFKMYQTPNGKQCQIEFSSTYKNSTDVLNLLLIEEGDKSHFLWIKNMSRLTAALKTKNKKNKTYTCSNCHTCEFLSLESLAKHESICLKHEASHVKMPHEESTMVFKNFGNKHAHPLTLYTDFESTLLKVSHKDGGEADPTASTQVTHRHDPNSFGLKLNCLHKEHSKEYERFICGDKDAVVATFVEQVEEYARYAFSLYQLNKDTKNIIFKQGEKQKHYETTECTDCGCDFSDDNKRVMHHDHISGEFISTVCGRCNLEKRNKRFLPVYIHNLKGYDSHLFVKALMSHGSPNSKITCVPNTEEAYMSFSKFIKVGTYMKKKVKKNKDDTETISYEEKDLMYEIRFLDSYAMLQAPLEELVSSRKKGEMTTEGLRKKFPNMSEAFPIDKDFLLLLQKGIYPYEYVSSFDVLENTKKLPKRHQFYSNLTKTSCTKATYKHAQNVFSHFKCKNLLDYHEIYLKTDVLLLADVWEGFKELAMATYGLDPTYYISCPSYSWDACLKVTKCDVRLLTDYEMYLMIESSIRGGLSQASTRLARANNPSMSCYDPSKPTTYISYLDENNLYAAAMSAHLPCGGFKWDTRLKSYWTEKAIRALGDKAKKGYTFEVSGHFPEDTHDFLNNFTPLPLNKAVAKKDLSADQQVNYKPSKVKKLCCTLEPRVKYVIHYRALKMALSVGFKIDEVHRVIQFDQAPFLKPYIDLNTKMRTKATTDFEKAFYKLMNNSCFGKTMENVRNRIDFKLVSSIEELDRCRRVKQVTIFDENLVGVHSARASLFLNKPIFIGACVLDDSKVIMQKFHFGFMKKKYTKFELVFTDTDSLCYLIYDQDPYTVMKKNSKKFDLSNFEGPMKDMTNEKVIAKMKDESPNNPIVEVIALRSKCNSKITQYGEGTELNSYGEIIKKARQITNKGVKKYGRKVGTKELLNHQDFRNCLNDGKAIYIEQNTFRNWKHQIYTISQQKKALSRTDDKVYICDDGIHTRTHGHYLNALENKNRNVEYK